MRQSQLTRRTKGTSITNANIARHNPIAAPRYSTGQASKDEDLANSALVLHNTAADAHRTGPIHLFHDGSVSLRVSLGETI
jgi:hypothetical protein